MNREEFQDALRKGLGRAVQHVRNSPPEEVREDLLHACLNNLCFDRQCEVSRAPWLYKMIEMTGEMAYYLANILEKYRTNDSDNAPDYDQLQLFHLIEEFAKRDDTEARTEVFRFFERQFEIEEYYDLFLGGNTIIAMDGIPGLLYVVERFGKRIKDGEYIILTPCFIEDAEEMLGKSEVENALRTASQQNAFIKIYLDHPETNRELVDAENASDRNESEEERRERVRDKYPLRKMIDHFLDNDFSEYADDEQFVEDPYRFLWYHASCKFHISGKWAVEEDLNYAYEKMMQCDDPLRKAFLLRTFTWQKLPKVDEKILALLDSDDDYLVHTATSALSNTNDPMVREKALELLQAVPTPQNWHIGIDLLESNFQEEDIDLLTFSIRTKPFPGNRCLEGAGIDMRNIYEKYPSEKFAEIFLWFYENGHCSFCRESFVEHLQTMQRLPQNILEECRDDCVPDIRELVDTGISKD